MRFVLYLQARVRSAKVMWDVEPALTPELRAALHPHEPERLRAGRLLRPFLPPVRRGGRRSARVRAGGGSSEPIAHAKGALVFAYEDESAFLIEAPEAP